MHYPYVAIHLYWKVLKLRKKVSIWASDIEGYYIHMQISIVAESKQSNMHVQWIGLCSILLSMYIQVWKCLLKSHERFVTDLNTPLQVISLFVIGAKKNHIFLRCWCIINRQMLFWNENFWYVNPIWNVWNYIKKEIHISSHQLW